MTMASFGKARKEKGKVIHIQHLVIYHFNTFINIGQQKEKKKYCKHVKLLLPKEKHTNGLNINMKMTNDPCLRHIYVPPGQSILYLIWFCWPPFYLENDQPHHVCT